LALETTLSRTDPRLNPGLRPRPGSRGRTKIEKGIREIVPGVYEVRIFLGGDPVTGKSCHRTKTVSGGIEKAGEELARLRVAHRAGTLGGPDAPGTFGALLSEWLEVGEKARGWEQRTVDEHRRTVEADRFIAENAGGMRGHERGALRREQVAIGGGNDRLGVEQEQQGTVLLLLFPLGGRDGCSSGDGQSRGSVRSRD
jgi:hypothetical protein